MSRYPGATWRPLVENATQRKIKPTQLIFHSAVSKGDSLFGYFSQKNVIVESHLYVQDDGDVEQYMDSHVQADANYKANPRAISVETWDNGDPDHVPWNSAQLYRLAEIAAWAHLDDDIPLVRAPSPTSPGMGGHTDYEEWSNVKGKTCPGLARKRQVKTILAMAQAMVDGHIPIPPKPEDRGELIVNTADEAKVRQIFQEELRTVLGNPNSDTDKDKTHYALGDVERDMNDVKEQVGELMTRVTDLADQFANSQNAKAADLPDPEPVDPEKPL